MVHPKADQWIVESSHAAFTLAVYVDLCGDDLDELNRVARRFPCP
jgi:hypothetical protein